jgi:hypothetical protein
MTPVFGPHTIQTLTDNFEKLSPNDQSFAASLLTAHKNHRERGWRFSPKQAAWAAKLAARATEADKPKERVSLAAIMDLFQRAATGLKRPQIILALRDAGISIRLTIAGDRARFPGSINIVQRSGDKAFFGRIRLDGTLDLRDDAPASLPDLLRAFAADPAGIAADYGHATGCCCFCAKELTDARSVAVGYGPICAEKWSLPWGEAPARAESQSGPTLSLDWKLAPHERETWPSAA